MKVSDFSVKAADRVKKQGVAELIDALAAGKVSVSAAARIAKLPAEQQQAVVAGIASGQQSAEAGHTLDGVLLRARKTLIPRRR
jgi:hypothetical protein